MRGYFKRLLATIMSVALLIGSVPATNLTAEAATGDVTTIDFGRPITGAVLIGGDGSDTGITAESSAGDWSITTSLAGTNWKINTDKTTVLKTDESNYQVANTDSATKLAGALYHQWNANYTAIQFNLNTSMAFDFTVPEAGSYQVDVTYHDHKRHQVATVDINNGALSATVPASASSGKHVTATLGTVILTAGNLGNTIVFTHASTGGNARYCTMIRSITLTKLEDTEVPTATPVPTLAPTLEPTEAPTAAPTAVPTATPVPTPTIAPTPMPTEDPNAVKEPFRVSVSDTDLNTIYIDVDSEGTERYYYTADTKGANWKIHPDTASKNLVGADLNTSNRAKGFITDNVMTTLAIYQKNADLVFAFTAPASGYYDLACDVVWNEKNGYTDIYLNDVYVGTLDGLLHSGVNEQKLLGVYLNGGEYANKIALRATGPSSGTNRYFNFRGFNFTTPETVASLNGVEIKASNVMFVGDTQTAVTNGSLTNGGLYRLSSVSKTASYTSSNEAVATITENGVITALSAGTTTITSTVDGLGYDTLEIIVSEVTYAEPEINIKENWIFTEGDTLTLEPKAKLTNGKYADASLVTAHYESSNENVIKIENGELKAVAPGTAKITATVTYDGSSLAVVRNVTVVEDLPEQPFELDVRDAKDLITDEEGIRFYFSKDTYGSNWRVSSKTKESILAQSDADLGKTRLFYGDYLTYLCLYKNGEPVIFDVDVPVAGFYDVTANVMKYEKGGYANVYVNDLYIGTIDSYGSPTDYTSTNKQPLLGVYLHAGVNTVSVKPTGVSGGDSFYTTFTGLSFTAPEQIATIANIDASADVEEMYVGRTEEISIEANLSNGGFYRFAHSAETLEYESSNEAVATVSDKGVITAVGSGEVTITVTAVSTGLTDTITFDVSDAAYEKAELNILENESVYVMHERPLVVTATLADGTKIAQKDLKVVYTSSDENVAVIKDDVLKVVGKGTTTIYAEATFKVDGVVKTDTKAIVADTMPLVGLTAQTEKTVVQELDTEGVKLIVKGVAEDGTILDDLVLAGFESIDITYTSRNPELLSVDANGICRYVSRGTAKVQVDAIIDGVTLQCVVDVISSSAKTGRTYYTDEMITNARYNVVHYAWGKKQLRKVAGQSYPFVYYLEKVYDMVPGEGIPRSYNNATSGADEAIKWFCPICGISVKEMYDNEWGSDPMNEPWKIWCKNCHAKFPSNDFALLYERGLDENGEYNRELAYANNAAAVARGEKDALVNELYPDKGPTWMVDDGFGWSPAQGTYGTTDPVQYTPVAKYMRDLWYDGDQYYMGYILYKIRDYYMYTGDERYGRAGAILLDRVADLYPSFDITKVTLGYANSHGGRYAGKIVGNIHEHYNAKYFLECYDAFYEMFDDPFVVEFLSQKSTELGLENPKTNGNLIRENIENGIVRECIESCYNCDIYGNFGMHQLVATIAAVVLDTQPETNEVLEWLKKPSELEKERKEDPIFGGAYGSRCLNTGGELITKYVNEIDRDGFGGEVSRTYNRYWVKYGILIADILQRYDTSILNLYDNPKFVKMFDSFIHLDAGDGYTLQFGDGGDPGGAAREDMASEVLIGYRDLRDPKLAQIYYRYMNGNFSNAYIDFYSEPRELIYAVQNEVKEHGELELVSESLTGYGLAIIRGGKLVDQYETRYDTWMYYGRTNTSHAHLDMLHLGIDAYGFNFMPDLGYPEATGATANRHEWVRNTLSHNTVTVNGLSQLGVYTGTPLHFDSTENVKVIDTECADVYEATSIYRRTAVTVAVNDDVSYTVDLFRVKGGNAHTYSFHTQSYLAWKTEDIAFVPQVNEKGEYVGTYAGADVPYGPDPNSTDNQYAAYPMYPRGYTWLERVNRGVDKTGDGKFTLTFDQTNFKHQVINSYGLKMNYHAVNDWTPDSVDLMIGHVPRKEINADMPGYDYMLIQRTGENLDTLFASVLEPYQVDSYINETESLTPQILSGTEGADDISKVVKVTLNSGRTDYIIYATNNQVTYTVTDGDVSFDFAGFVGVYSVDYFGNNIYSYVNDGTLIGNETSVGAYTGTVVDFTKELVMDDYIIIKPDQTIEDLSVLTNQYIYVDNEGAKCNGAYRILSAEQQGENISLYLGNCSLIENFIDDYNFDAGYVYTIADGQSFRIPVSAKKGAKFSGTNKPQNADGSEEIDTTVTDLTDLEAIIDRIEIVEEQPVDFSDDCEDTANDGYDITDDVVELPVTPEPSEGLAGEPTATPNADKANASSKGVSNILLGGLGIAALVAGFLLILLSKKKDKEEA